VVPVSQKKKGLSKLQCNCYSVATSSVLHSQYLVEKKKQNNITQIVWKFRELGNSKEFRNSEKENNIALHSGK
jgi:hypothetical protein